MIFTVHEGQEKELVLVDRKTHRQIGRFTNGELETTNEKLIKKLIGKYPVKEEEPAFIQCKKCEFKTFNRGTLLAHYRQNHPK